MTSELAELAEDPEFHLEPPEGAERIVDDRYCVVIGSERRWAGVCRLRLADEPAAITAAVDEILGLVGDIDGTVWSIGSTAEPPLLPDRLRTLAFRDPEPPWEPLVAAMVLVEEPPTAAGVEVRRIETFEDHLAGLEIMLAADSFSPAAVASERDAGAPDVREAHAPRRAAMARCRRRHPGSVRHRRSVPGGAVSRGWCNASRGAGPRVLSRSRPGSLAGGDVARPPGARRPGAVRIVGTDPATARIRRDRHDPLAQVAGRSGLTAKRGGSPAAAVPGLPRAVR